MIPKGLKVGDTFTDNGNTYKVLKVNGEEYSSTLIKIGLDDFSEKEDFSAVPYAQLKKMCAERGLDATGSKNDLIARLEG